MSGLEFNEGNENFYQTDGAIWKHIVFPLLKVVPLIVIDLSDQSEGVSDELSFIARNPALIKKTTVFGDPGVDVKLKEWHESGSSFDVVTIQRLLSARIANDLNQIRAQGGQER